MIYLAFHHSTIFLSLPTLFSPLNKFNRVQQRSQTLQSLFALLMMLLFSRIVVVFLRRPSEMTSSLVGNNDFFFSASMFSSSGVFSLPERHVLVESLPFELF